jgi:hypothetical protein
MAAIILKNSIKQYWNEKQEEKEIITKEDKDLIKKNIPKGLYDKSKLIVISTSMIIGVICEYDFPEEWSDILTNLVYTLTNSSVKNPETFGKFILKLIKKRVNDMYKYNSREFYRKSIGNSITKIITNHE